MTPVSATKKALAKLQGLLGVNPQALGFYKGSRVSLSLRFRGSFEGFYNGSYTCGRVRITWTPVGLGLRF